MSATIQSTIKETIRRQVLLVSTILVLLLLGTLWYFIAHQQKTAISTTPLANAIQSMTDLAMGGFIINLVVAFFAIFSVSGNLSSEIETGVLASVVARPIRRYQIILGKWIGIATIELFYVSFVFGGVIGIVFAYNYWVTPIIQIVAAWGLYVLEGWILTALSLFLSIWLSPVAGGVGLSILYFTEFLAGAFAQTGSGHESPIHLTASILTLFLPTDSLYRRATFEIFGGSHNPIATGAVGNLGPFGANFVPSWGFTFYAVVYLTALLLIAVKVFEHHDI